MLLGDLVTCMDASSVFGVWLDSRVYKPRSLSPLTLFSNHRLHPILHISNLTLFSMRATLHISLLAATLSPSLVHSSPIPFTQNYNSSPRSASQALSGSGRPGGAFSSPSLLPRGGLGLGLLDIGSGNGGDGGDASSGSSYAQGGYALIVLPASAFPNACIWYRDHPGDGGRPVIDLGPSSQPQPEPVHDAPSGDTNPNLSGPSDELPPPRNPDVPKAADGKNNNPPNGGTPASFQSDPAQLKPPPVNTDDPAIPPQKSEPDPGANGTPPGIPIFLGPSNPSNDRPPSGDIGPSSDPMWPHGDEKGFEDNSDSSCDGILGDIFGGSLINVLSNNGGDGGVASSGKATR
ncbi:hypothetical protein H4582DRAFT_920603 [Lactarius indigo]|nr:hypothetical protein H4582DRAFT_920603 [Lactarius indigo]